LAKFTVVGYYEESGQRYCSNLAGDTWVEATQAAIAEAGMDLIVVEVFPGWLAGLTEGDHVEHACDFVAEWDFPEGDDDDGDDADAG
jgi:hypothetical protein